jgi:preprotein translocase subunit YajC
MTSEEIKSLMYRIQLRGNKKEDCNEIKKREETKEILRMLNYIKYGDKVLTTLTDSLI